jgi:hypothetical protein
MAKAKGRKGRGAAEFESSKRLLGPNPSKNKPWQFAALKRKRAEDFSEGVVRASLLASAQGLESYAREKNIPFPGGAGGGAAGAHYH